MANLMERLKAWNLQMNGLPRKAWLIVLTLLLCGLFILLVPLCWPFLLALLFSMMLMPLIRLCENYLRKVKPPRWLITLVGMLLLFGVLGAGLGFLFNRLFRELVSLTHSIPNLVRWVTDTAVPYLKSLYDQYAGMASAPVMDAINQGLSSLGDSVIKAAGSLSAALTSGAVGVAASIPSILLSVVLTVMGTFYITADRERIMAFLKRTFPVNMQKHSQLLKTNLFHALFGQVKSQLTVSLMITSFLILAFTIYGIRYGLLMGFVIGLADALPVIGAGLFLVPWGILELLLGHYGTGIFLMAVYVGTVLIRQIFEPRIVGANLGLYPLATMIAMFAGLQLFGVLGLLGGPILLNLLKVVLEADGIAHGLPPSPAEHRGKRIFRPRPAISKESGLE